MQAQLEVDLRAQPHPSVPCAAVGPKDSWRHAKTRYPRCNRPESHTGPHRVYSVKAEVLAEWTPSEAPTSSTPDGSDDLS